MNKQVKDTIINNQDLINNNEFQELYSRLHDTSYSKELTEILLRAGIDPTPYFKSIPPYSYYESTLTDIKLSSNCKKIGEYAFFNSSIKSVNLDDVDEIGLKAFSYSEVTSISIKPNCLMGLSAFDFCENLSKVEFLGKQTIPTYCFMNCSQLKDVKFNSTFDLQSGSFYHCKSLKNIDLENCLSLSDKALAGTAIEYVRIGEHCVFIADSVFKDCNNLKTITIMSEDTQLSPNFWTNNFPVRINCYEHSLVFKQLSEMNNPFIHIDFL